MASTTEHELEQVQSRGGSNKLHARLRQFPPRLEYPATVREISISSHDFTLQTGEAHSEFSSLLQPPDPGDVIARVFVIQGGEDLRDQLSAWIEADVGPRRRFLDAHLDNNEDAQRELHQERDGVLFLNWVRLASQGKDQHEIEQRVLAGKPYDTDTGDDPARLNLNHKRYYRWPRWPWRPYDLISVSEQGSVFHHAVEEGMSLYSEDANGVFTALLLVDPIRYFRIFDVTYHFWKSKLDIPELDKTPCFLESQEQYTITDGKKDKQPAQKDQSRHQQPLERFIALMMQVTPPQAANSEPRRLIQGVFAQLMCEDLPPILGKMALALKQIELSLHDDRVLQKSIHVWRRQLGRWRNTLFHQSEQLRDLSLDFLMPGETAESTQDTLHSRLDRLATTVDRASRRVESDFQALMSSMSIVESERAIAEAEVVSKLTHLAFFFIPLSLVAGVFGMNIIEFQDKLTWWHWLVVSVVASATTYAMLYRAGILSWMGMLPATARGLSIQRLSRLAVRWLSIVNSVVEGLPRAMVFLLFVGVVAGLSVGTWKLAVSGLSVAAKASIAVFVIWLPFLFGQLTLYFFVRARIKKKYSTQLWELTPDDASISYGPGRNSRGVPGRMYTSQW